MSSHDPVARKALSIIVPGVSLFLIIVLGIVSVILIRQHTQSTSEVYDVYRKSDLITQIKESLLEDRIMLYDISLKTGNPETEAAAILESQRLHALCGDLLNEYETTIINPEARKRFDEFNHIYRNEYYPLIISLQSLLENKDYAGYTALLAESGEIFSQVSSPVEYLQNMNNSFVEEYCFSISNSGNNSMIILISAVSTSFVILLILLIASIII